MAIQALILGAPITGAAVESRPVVDAALTSRVNALEPKVTANTTAIGNIGSVLDVINGVTV